MRALPALLAWLIISTSAHEGKHQSIVAIQYGSFPECAHALKTMKMVVQPGGNMPEMPYCTDTRPEWWRVKS